MSQTPQLTKAEHERMFGVNEQFRVEVFKNQQVYQFDTRLPKILTDEIVNYYSQYSKENATTIGNEKNLRDTDVYWGQPNDWVGPFMYNYISQCNEHLFQYDIQGVYFTEVHMLNYNPGQYYGWHVDSQANNMLAYAPPAHQMYLNYPIKEWTRKLSFTLQLSDESDYTGGDVELATNDDLTEPFVISKQCGSLVVFDSKIKHRVLPVETGNRKVLVGWAVGPRWK